MRQLLLASRIHFHQVIDLKSITLIKISSRISLVSMSRNCATQVSSSLHIYAMYVSLTLARVYSIYFSTRHLIDYLKRYKFILLIYFKHSCVALFSYATSFSHVNIKTLTGESNSRYVECYNFPFVVSCYLTDYPLEFLSFIIYDSCT